MTQPTILVAEDDISLLTALTERLKSSGFNVIAVQDGYQALEYCRRARPDLMLLDVNMPAGSGLSVQQRMRKCAELADIPVVYLTGDSRESVVCKAHDLGAVAVLHKPVRTEELLAVVHSIIERRMAG